MKSTANISQKLYQVKGSHCGGCKAKIEAHLLGLTDVQVAEMDLATKRLSVVGSIDPREVLSNLNDIGFNASLIK